MTVPIISIVGNSGAGKTTFLEKLIRELKRRGYRVAAIKHDIHNFQMDHPGKDTYRLAEAGSELVATSQDLPALITDQQFDLDVPHFGLNDAPAVANLLERHFAL